MKRNFEGIKVTGMNKQPAKLVTQCLRLFGKSELEPRDRYNLYENRWNYYGGSDEFWIDFITKLSYDEIVSLGLDSKKEKELMELISLRIKFKKSVHGQYGSWTSRDRMVKENIDMEKNEWFLKELKMEDGVIELTVPKSGTYEIIQQSRSTNPVPTEFGGQPAFGVNLELKMNLEKGRKLFIFIADTVFLFDENMRLISVPGAAGIGGSGHNNGSMTTEPQHSDVFGRGRGPKGGYNPKMILNGINHEYSWTGSGYRNGLFLRGERGASYQGGSTFADRNYCIDNYEPIIRQNVEIPEKGDFSEPFITIKRLSDDKAANDYNKYINERKGIMSKTHYYEMIGYSDSNLFPVYSDESTDDEQ